MLAALAFSVMACGWPHDSDAVILKSTFDGAWVEVGRVTGYGERNLSVCLDDYAPALSDRAASLAVGKPAEFTCKAGR